MTAFTVDKEHSVVITSNKVNLDGLLYIPNNARGIVLFAHGSGSSRFSTRNQFVARKLNEAKLATLLFDLLTSEEEEVDDQTRELRFNIEFLAQRLLDATNWCLKQFELTPGYFGASTGGGAALVAAATSHAVQAVVSRGGRPDLAGSALAEVKAPTLLIVGGEDGQVITMNTTAMAKMHCPTQLEIIAGATHLFEEPGTLEQVALLATKWFTRYLN